MRRETIAVWLLLLAAAGCAEPAQLQKQRLVNAIRRAILESVEAEKSAVLATTDEESRSLAHETQRFAEQVDRDRAELRRLIAADGREQEVKALDAFDAVWAEFEGVDKRLLALAVANTNLKATQLSAREGTDALNRLVDRLLEMQGATAQPELIRTLSKTSVAAFRVQSLLMVHIPASGDEMERIEKQMAVLRNEIDGDLAGLQGSDQITPEQLAAANQAWSDYRRLVDDIVRLSRENTNVISFDVSVHEKRLVTQECLAALTTLAEAVDPGARATR